MSKDFIPTLQQHSLLQKGLTFVPNFQPHRNDKLQLLSDLQVFHRRIMLASYFEGKQSKEPIPFTPKSNWTPHINQLPAPIRKFVTANHYAYKTLNWQIQQHPNLTPAELQALKELQLNHSLIIKPADKGSAVVILDREDYIWEARRQLNDPQYYTKLTSPIYLDTIPIIKEIVLDMWEKKYINHKQRNYLIGLDNPRPRRFYWLPKIHKEPQNWSIPFKIPPGRPIVSDCDSESYQIAEYIDHFLQPISIKHPSYLKDTYDFIQKIRNQHIPRNSFLFTMDIDNLYTNIETQTGLKAVREWFKRYPEKNRPDSHILKLLEISLIRNDFEFDSEFYLQIKGTAMGKRFAPAYANIYMAHWEESALSSTPIKPKFYFRFLDDIWGVWDNTEQAFQLFINHLNQHHPSIKVKFVLDHSQINFLDTVTYKGKDFIDTGKLDIKVYFKNTDTHALLHRHSFHPRHTFRGIVKSQLLRFSKICTKQEDFWEATKVLFSALRKRGYSRSFLRNSCKSFRDTVRKDNKELIPLITTYSMVNKELNFKIRRNFESTISNSPILKKCKLISAFRKNKNLGDLLVHSKMKPIQQRPNFKGCPEFRQIHWVSNKKTKEVASIRPLLKPQTKNCIYLLYCSKCPAQYVGETRNSIACRITQHRHNIRHQKETHTKIVQHFIMHGLQAMRVTGLQSHPLWTYAQRKNRESQWIKTLGTQYPAGLNELT